MKIIESPKPLMDRIHRALNSDVIDGWGRQGPYLVFMRGTARFYVRRQEAEHFVDRLMDDTSLCDQNTLYSGLSCA